jgi:hypothetical protein
MLKVSVKADIAAALRSFDLLLEDAGKAIPRALNKTATTARAQAAREIRATGYGIKVNEIKNAISIRRATSAELTAILRVNGRPIPLIKYGAKQTKAGVSVAVLNGRKLIKSAFIATMPTGHKGVFLRVGSAAERSLISRGSLKITKGKVIAHRKHGLPIRELFGPAVPQAFMNDIVQEALAKSIRERFGVVLEQELRFIKLSP